MKNVKQDIMHITEYFEGFDDFIGDTHQMKILYFRLMNYVFSRY